MISTLLNVNFCISDTDKPTITQYNLRIVSRDEWNALPAKSEIPKFKSQPVSRLHLSKHRTKNCRSLKLCGSIMREIQLNDTNTKGYDDIGGSFFITNDGTVYEGRGWDLQRPESRRNNQIGLEFVFIGSLKNFKNASEALAALIYYGASKNKLTIGNYGISTDDWV